MSHTPGPWSVLTLDDGTQWIEAGCVRVAIMDDSAGCQPGNAALIAAAPEMYIALQNVRVELDSYPHCPFCGSVHGEGHEKDCIGYEVEAAIRKARGEE